MGWYGLTRYVYSLRSLREVEKERRPTFKKSILYYLKTDDENVLMNLLYNTKIVHIIKQKQKQSSHNLSDLLF